MSSTYKYWNFWTSVSTEPLLLINLTGYGFEWRRRMFLVLPVCIRFNCLHSPICCQCIATQSSYSCSNSDSFIACIPIESNHIPTSINWHVFALPNAQVQTRIFEILEKVHALPFSFSSIRRKSVVILSFTQTFTHKNVNRSTTNTFNFIRFSQNENHSSCCRCIGK